MAVRITAHLLPSTRNPNVGTALALHKAAQPGAWGAADDLARALTGAESRWWCAVLAGSIR